MTFRLSVIVKAVNAKVDKRKEKIKKDFIIQSIALLLYHSGDNHCILGFISLDMSMD